MYQEMQARELDLNEVTFGCLIDACVSCEKLDIALKLLEQ
jgi:pentatricopeptide repeat domain-containing protein 1